MESAPSTASLIAVCRNQDQAALAALLETGGYREANKSATNLLLLQEEHGLSPEKLAELAVSALECAAPDQALNALERLAGGLSGEQLKALFADKPCCEVLLTVLGASQFLATILFRHNTLLDSLFLQGGYRAAKSEPVMLAELQQRIPDGASFEELQRGLRLFKQQEILRIATRDLTSLADLTATTAELSDLAAATLQRSYQICDQLLRARYGAPLLGPDSDAPGEEALFTVLAMGKFGGRELNFSSDIDLIFCYSCELGETAGILDGDTLHNRIALHQYFVKLGEKINQAMHQVTADGFVFRVDLRLRPEGRSGEIASSLSSTEAYYEHWGQSWERSAMLKARPVAGCVDFGNQLLHNLEPFIYRRFLDYTMIEDLKVMKQKIDHNLTREREGELNLKLGRGGIREIEFFIQAMQLIHAGKHPALRDKNSLRALALLQSHGLIDAETGVILSEAYSFLRTVEHRIQVVQERQTHNLPTDPLEFERLARRCGYRDSEPFRQVLESYRREVAAIYHDLFYTSEEEAKAEAVPSEIDYLFDPAAEPEELLELLRAKGFADPHAARDSLTVLRDGPRHHPLSPQARRHFDRIAPLLVSEIIALPEPDMAFRNLERFLGALRARATFFALLAENRAIIRLLVSLFGTSQFLSRILIQHPGTLDYLVAGNASGPLKERTQLEADLAKHLERTTGYEEQLDALRRFHKEELLRLALGDIHGDLSLQQVSAQLTLLAEVCLQQATAIARHELLPRYGLPCHGKGGKLETAFAVVGMGKLGGCELNYHSDLDLIFIYEEQGHTRPAAGCDSRLFKERSNQEYFSVLAQRIISILSLVTSEGILYKIDTRLRPSGQQGQLVSSLPAFRAYHQQSTRLWERQALIKARVVVSPANFAEQIQQLQRQIAFDRTLPEDSQQEIYRLRQRLEKELARENRSHFDLKTGRGGLLDVEFLVQYLQLLHGAGESGLRAPNTLDALQALQSRQYLNAEQAGLLADGYLFLRRLENKLRLVHDQSISQLSSDPLYLAKLARRLDYAEPHPEEQLLADYQQTTERIRALFEHHLA